MKVSTNIKKVLDFCLAIAGFAVGLATNTGIIGPVVGLGCGYLVSDIVSEVDAGTVDTATLTQQIETILPKILEPRSANGASAQAK